MAPPKKSKSSRSSSGPPSRPLTPEALDRRKSWKPLPAVCALSGDARFFKDQIVRRFSRELFGDAAPEVTHLQGPLGDQKSNELPLSAVLDELRTPSFFSPVRLVVVSRAAAFIAENRDALLPFVESGFAGGHLILLVDGKLDARTKFARAISEHGWLVHCAQPFDRPPPWEPRAPVWDSALTHWVVRHAKSKGLAVEPRVAFALHDRTGADLSVIDEELDKISTYLAEQRGDTTVTEDVIRDVTGDLREDSIFQLVDLVLEQRRVEAVHSVERLFERGVHDERGNLVRDPPGIALPFLATLTQRLRALRRAQAMAADGAGPDEWIRARLTQQPFIDRFRRQIRSTPPRRIRSLLERLFAIDRSIKTGGDPRRLLTLLVLE